ncbi:conserved hypothetical protein [Aspergillus fumigatus A1163]|uniref:Uncharacterized protein n=1 Tax=Aspergillus fumigatus (strain CBS 144.89 / FGSC A1163 / CEA10) TaxID=451804 RepID=B0Y7Z5_ASPFC|nr:conserved hypothetical protein [Aspergillus fumigatus A1163]
MSGHPSGTLHTVCQVECIRCNDLPDAMTDLLDSAMQIISAVMDFVKYCDQEDSIRQQYTWIYDLSMVGLFIVIDCGMIAGESARTTQYHFDSCESLLFEYRVKGADAPSTED